MVTPSALYERLPRLRRRDRRIAVIAAFGGFPLLLLGYAALVEPGRLSSLAWTPIALVLLGASIVGAIVVAGYARGRFDDRARTDERQRLMVDRALILSYGVLTTGIILVAGLVALYASFIGPVVLEMDAFSPWLIAIAVYVPFLPLGALAWLEPDAPADDDGR
jgi:uncharacterized sodium:solute symporter family permease YidK